MSDCPMCDQGVKTKIIMYIDIGLKEDDEYKLKTFTGDMDTIDRLMKHPRFPYFIMEDLVEITGEEDVCTTDEGTV